MSAMISIDFGNSFTKVGIRLDNQSQTELVKDANLQQDDGLNICIPSLVARKKNQWYYGMDVLQFAAHASNVQVFRNWKPLFFRGLENKDQMTDSLVHVGAGASQAGARQLYASEVVAFAEKAGVSLAELEALLRNKGTIIVPQGPSSAAPLTTTEEAGTEELDNESLENVGIGFFSWLRQFIGPFCHKKGIEDVSNTPVRISLPSFGSHTKAEELLVDILEKSGWKPDPRIPAITEPISNSIGIFTKGRNATFRNKKYPGEPEHISNGRMFGFEEPGLFLALREQVLTSNGLQCYWAMGVDLGGYTADFAMLGFDLEKLDTMFEGKFEDMNRRARKSWPIGIRTLDARIRNQLSGPKQAFFREINEDPDQRKIETFHRFVYDNLKPYDAGKYGVIGEGKEGDRLRECIQTFADEVASYAEEFLITEQYKHIDALILTGGGCNIPIIRDTLCKRLASKRRESKFSVTYVPSRPTESLPPGFQRRDPLDVRGATAIGGASVFFDFAPEVI